MTIEDLLRRTLADRDRDVQGDDDLAAGVIRRAARGRRSWIGAVVAVLLLALVSAVAVRYGLGQGPRTGPDPRATGIPVITASATASASSSAALQTPYRLIEGPMGTTAAVESLSTGPAISALPRVEKRGARTWFLASTGGHPQPDVSVPMGSDVNGARSILPVVGGWVVQTVSDGFTGGDTDSGSHVLFVSYMGAVTSLVTGAVRSVAVHPSGTEVAWVETTEHPTWSVTLVVEEIPSRKVVRRVALPAGQPGYWPYPHVAWTPDGIVASESGGPAVVVSDTTVTSLAGVTGVVAPSDGSLIVVETTGAGPNTCLLVELTSTPTPVLCGLMVTVAAVAGGVVVAEISDPGAARPRAAVIDTRSQTVTVLTLPLVVTALGLGLAYPDGTGHVLVHNAERNVWLRWDTVANTVEIAPLPSGASAAVSW